MQQRKVCRNCSGDEFRVRIAADQAGGNFFSTQLAQALNQHNSIGIAGQAEVADDDIDMPRCLFGLQIVDSIGVEFTTDSFSWAQPTPE